MRDLKKVEMNQFRWKYAELPNYREPTEAERELIRIIGHSPVDPESTSAVLSLMVHEAERSSSGVLNVAWLGAWIFEAGKIHGIRQERARRKNGKESMTNK